MPTDVSFSPGLFGQPAAGMPPAPAPPVSTLPEQPALQPLATPFKSPLRLTPDQAKNFHDQNLTRIFELQREMGLTPTNDVIAGTWMWARRCHEQYYEGDLSWRLAFGGIFAKSNFTLGSGLRHVRYIAARVQDDLLGTSPFMGSFGRNPDKEEMAKQVEEFIQTEIENSDVRQNLRDAQKIALYRNECVVKTGYISDTTPFVGEATVLVDARTGQPIKTPDKGLWIYEDDQMIPHPDVQGLMMLENDPSFLVAQNPQPGLVTVPATATAPEITATYQRFDELPQVLTRREGVYADPLDYRSFLCPLKVKSIHEADCVVHLYLDSPSRINKVYGQIDVSQQYFSWWQNPGQDKPKLEQGERNEPTTVIHQQIIIAEVYRRCDPDGTGEDKEIFSVIDMTNQKTIYWNYLANHMARRPFDPIPGVEKIPGRWYGRGIYGMLENHLLYEDAELNRANFKNSKDATIQFAYRDACDAWKNGQPPVVGTEDTHWISPNWNPDGNKKPIWRENLYEKIETDIEMMNTMRQSADSLVGSISTQSANQSNFDQSKTATGNQLVQQASDVITKATEQDQTEALNAILAQVVDVILEHMDRKQFTVNPATNELAHLNRNEARNLSRDVRLLLTRSKSTQLLNTSGQALVIAEKYLDLVDANPQKAKTLRPLVIAQLKGLEVDDPDHLCPDVTDDMIKQWQQAQAQKQPTAPVSHAISAKLEDFTPEERPQAVEQFGIQPSSPEEAAAYNAQQLAAKHPPKPAPGGGGTPPAPPKIVAAPAAPEPGPRKSAIPGLEQAV